VRILLDECVPWPLAKLLSGHECSSPVRLGWGGIKNGELLSLAEGSFDLFITSDQNLRYQQNLSGRIISILELSTNDWHSIQESADHITATIQSVSPGDFIRLIVEVR
jgi:hypothetical protein